MLDEVQSRQVTCYNQCCNIGEGVVPRSRVLDTPSLSDDKLYQTFLKESTESITGPNCEIRESVKEYCEAVDRDSFSRILRSVREKSSFSSNDANSLSDLLKTFNNPSLQEIYNYLETSGQNRSKYITYNDFLFTPSSSAKAIKNNPKLAIPILHPQIISTFKVLCDFVKVCFIYGYRDSKENLRTRMIKVLCQWTRMLKYLDFNFIKLTKYKLAAFASYAKNSTIFPPSPFNDEFIVQNRCSRPYLIFDSTFNRWFESLNIDDFDGQCFRMSLIDSVCRGIKKGADRPSNEMAHLSNLSTFALFTTQKEKPLMEDDDMLYHFSVEDMEAEVTRTVDEIFKNFKEPVLSYGNFPSLSSCVENVFANGGSLLPVKRVIGPYPRVVEVKPRYGLLKTPLPQSHNKTGERDPFVRSPFPKEETHDGSSIKSIKYIELKTNPDNLGTDIDIEAEVAKCIQYGSEMKLVALLEALKIRGISTANAMETFLLKPIQKIISKQLLKFACFAVTGTPLKPEHLEKVFKEIKKNQTVVSGDYDNATNEMINSYTGVCIRRVCHYFNLSEDYTQLCVNSLCHNIVLYSYRNDIGKKVELSGSQKEAQPMGKVLSFTVLCIINATVCRKALEMDTRTRIPLRSFPGLINGDDCCFAMYNTNLWEKCAAMVGLKNSIGKTFFSRDFIEMNSRTFMIDKTHPDTVWFDGDIYQPKFREIPFANFGLIKGLLRSQQSDKNLETIDRVSSLGWCHNDMVKDMDFAYDSLDFLFRQENKERLNVPELAGIPFYVPKWLGGLGFNPGPNFHHKVTEEQRKQASLIFQQIGEKRPKQISTLKTCLLDSKISEMEEQIATTFGVDFEETQFEELELECGEMVSLEKENQESYKALVEMMWRNLHIIDLKTDLVDINDNPDDSIIAKHAQLHTEWFKSEGLKPKVSISFHDFMSQKKMRKDFIFNSKMWRDTYARVMQHGDKIEPLPWYKMWHERRRGLLPIVLGDSTKEYKEWCRQNCIKAD